MGAFSKSARPLIPGPYFNWQAQPQAVVPPAIGSIVAIAFTSDWGPFKTPTLVNSYDEYIAAFGPTVGTPGQKAAWLAFTGEGGVGGRSGAGAVLAFRMGAAAAAKASKVLQNATPVNAITLTAKYEGTFGNGFRVTTQDHASDTTKNELLLFNGSQLLETYVYTDTDIAGLVTQINAVSRWITATLTQDGVALGAVSAQAFTGGNDGTTVLSSDWTAMQTAMGSQRFGVFVPYGLTDTAIQTALLAWAGGLSSGTTAGLNATGHRFEVILGGLSNETASTAVARAALENDGNFATIGMSSFKANDLLDANGNPTTLASAEFAAAVAGSLAARGEAASLTYARFPDVTLLNAPTDADVVTCLNGGVMPFAVDSHPDAPVHIVAARTTFTKGSPTGAAAVPAFPYLVYRNPKFMRTMQNVEMEFSDWARVEIIGQRPVNNKTRDAAVAEVSRRMRVREAAGVIQPGWVVAVDNSPPPSDSDEFIAIAIGLKFGRSVEFFFFTATVS